MTQQNINKTSPTESGLLNDRLRIGVCLWKLLFSLLSLLDREARCAFLSHILLPHISVCQEAVDLGWTMALKEVSSCFNIIVKKSCCVFCRRTHMWCYGRTIRNWRGTTATKASVWTCWKSWQTFSSSSIGSGWWEMDFTACPGPTEPGPAWWESSSREYVKYIHT